MQIIYRTTKITVYSSLTLKKKNKTQLFSGYTRINLNMLTACLQFGFGRLVSLECGFKKLVFDSLPFKCSIFWFQRCLFKRICTLSCLCTVTFCLHPPIPMKCFCFHQELRSRCGLAFLSVEDTQCFYFWLKLPHQSARNIKIWPTSGKLQAQRATSSLWNKYLCSTRWFHLLINETLPNLDCFSSVKTQCWTLIS